MRGVLPDAGTDPAGFLLAALPARVADKIEVGPDCWLWRGGLDYKGYGRVKVDGRMLRAHRVVYAALVGPIEPKLTLDHLCRVRHCVRPSHLEPVSGGVNTMRSALTVPFVQAAKTHCPHDHPYDAQNTYVDSRGWRACRACAKIRASRRSRSRRAPAAVAAARAYLDGTAG